MGKIIHRREIEMLVGGVYHWAPFEAIVSAKFVAPSELRDLAWTEAEVTFANGGTIGTLVPSRYVGSTSEPALALARETRWQAMGAASAAGFGQRLLVSDAGDHDFLTVREITLAATPGADASETSDGG